MTKKLTAPDEPGTKRTERQEKIEVGQWYWLTHEDYRGKEVTELTCVVHLGSNYAQLEDVGRGSTRVHFDEFDQVTEFEPNPEPYIQSQIDRHQDNVRELMDEVKQLTAGLGISRGMLTEAEAEVAGSTNALVKVHGTKNVEQHKKALVKAKEKTLPDLFKRIEKEHEAMAMWMKATLIPRKAEAEGLKQAIEVIERQIFTVELYAGLVEEVEKIRDGEPAPNETKIHLMQRRHYMDEECLVEYQAGGMEFKDIRAFERWMLRKKSRRERLFPFTRCVVVFQVRRRRKERETPVSLHGFINMMHLEDADKQTFLYIRNGEQYFRLQTAIKFESQLFPDKEHSLVFGDNEIWVKLFGGRVQEVVSAGEVEAVYRDYEQELADYEKAKRKWKRMTKAQRKGKASPWRPSEPFYRYAKATPESVYYDDAMKAVAHEMMKHNRVAVVLQGLLDRSPVFHPHPPWQLWTPEGFNLGLELVYDSSRALTDGDPPNFRAFQLRLNMSLGKGCYTVGQEEAWERAEAKKENDRQRRDWRVRHHSDYKHYRPYGNPGPGVVAQVVRFGRKRECTFEWYRERLGYRWVPREDRPGFEHLSREGEIKCRFTCSDSELLNVSAYQPGDYLQFYRDPRTRADYLQWAPMLLAAEDWHAAQKKGTKK